MELSSCCAVLGEGKLLLVRSCLDGVDQSERRCALFLPLSHTHIFSQFESNGMEQQQQQQQQRELGKGGKTKKNKPNSTRKALSFTSSDFIAICREEPQLSLLLCLALRVPS